MFDSTFLHTKLLHCLDLNFDLVRRDRQLERLTQDTCLRTIAASGWKKVLQGIINGSGALLGASTDALIFYAPVLVSGSRRNPSARTILRCNDSKTAARTSQKMCTTCWIQDIWMCPANFFIIAFLYTHKTNILRFSRTHQFVAAARDISHPNLNKPFVTFIPLVLSVEQSAVPQHRKKFLRWCLFFFNFFDVLTPKGKWVIFRLCIHQPIVP